VRGQPGLPNGQYYIVNLENNVLVEILNTVNAIIADPDTHNYEVEHAGAHGAKRAVMHRYIKGFSTIAYAEDGIHPPRR
jgi:hypothetical protein